MCVIVVDKAKNVPKDAIDGKPTLVYWNILGLAQAIRFSLVYAGVDFVDVRIDAGDINDKEKYGRAWKQAKPGLGKSGTLDFPNLPYYLDYDDDDHQHDHHKDKIAISQSDAILRYVGRKCNLMGPCRGKEYIVDQALDELKDLIGTLTRFYYVEGREALSKWYESNIVDILSRWKRALADEEYVAGGLIPSIADFKLYVVLYNIVQVQEEFGFKSTEAPVKDDWIVEYMNRIEGLYKIKKYMQSSDYMSRPLNNPSATFNN